MKITYLQKEDENLYEGDLITEYNFNSSFIHRVAYSNRLKKLVLVAKEKVLENTHGPELICKGNTAVLNELKEYNIEAYSSALCFLESKGLR